MIARLSVEFCSSFKGGFFTAFGIYKKYVRSLFTLTLESRKLEGPLKVGKAFQFFYSTDGNSWLANSGFFIIRLSIFFQINTLNNLWHGTLSFKSYPLQLF